MRTQRRARDTGSLYQRCDTTRGCPALIEGVVNPLTGKASHVRPEHSCKGPWVAAITLPNLTGQRRRKVVVRAKKADAIKELRALRDQLERAGDLATTSPTLSAWLDVWWERYGLKQLKVSSRSVYKSRMEQYIRPAIGNVRLDKLTPAHIHQLHAFVTDQKGLSVTTARGTHRVLSAILADALTEDKVTRNLCLVVKPPAPAVHSAPYLDSAQARSLMRSVDPGDGTVSRDLAMWTLALMTGVRQAERLGLTREMIDLENESITVAWQLKRLAYEHGCGKQTGAGWPCGRRKGGYCNKRRMEIPANQEARHVEGGLYLLRPKTKASWRRVPMFGPLAWAMRTYLDSHEPGMEGLIFTRRGGRPIDPSDDSPAWTAALAAAGLPKVKGHSARHSCNTILTELGVPVDVRTQIIGHASAAVNEQVYTHTSDARVLEAMTALTSALDWRQV